MLDRLPENVLEKILWLANGKLRDNLQTGWNLKPWNVHGMTSAGKEEW